MTAKILVVDDAPAILKLIKRSLTENGFPVVVANSGSDGLLLVRESGPDLLLVDAEMPGLDGHALCRVVKADPRQIPIIIMSGTRVEEKDVLAGFEGGADDYVFKPFSMPVLLARVRAVLRRYSASSVKEEPLRTRGIELDAAVRTVKVDGKAAALTRKEFELLAALIERSGRVLSVPYLLETVWGYDPADYNDPSTVEVHISHLRRKLGRKAGKLIVNVVGHGYRFDD